MNWRFWRPSPSSAPPPAPPANQAPCLPWEFPPDLDAVALLRSILAWCAGRPGCRGAWLICPTDPEWAARDRFEDADPLPETLIQALTTWVHAQPGGVCHRLSTHQTEGAPAGLAEQCRRREIGELLVLPVPHWAPLPAWLLVGQGQAGDPEREPATVTHELAWLLWINRLRRELGVERGRVEEAQAHQMVKGFELERIRQQAEREVELARRHVSEAERAKNEFLSSVSHELRTPLNAIQGYTRMVLRESNLSDRQCLSLERVMTSSQNQLRLINNILDYSRLEAGRMRLELEELDLLQLLRDVVLQVEPLAQERGLTVVLELPAGQVESTFVSDRAKVEQVLINLLGNAIKFTPKGEVRLRAGAEAGLIRLDVMDTGIGIARDEQEQVFERFRRSRQTDGVMKASGTGLGLAISRRLAQLLGGDIVLQSEAGRGSTFTLTLPHFLDLETATMGLGGDEGEEGR